MSLATASPTSDLEAIQAALKEQPDGVLDDVARRHGVFETKAPLPPGSEARGHFNIHGESPLGGHLRIARCAAIYFIDRPFFGRRSCSLQFINIDGGAMFKVFVGRDEKRELIADQLVRFERLRDAETTAA